jgi:hypothetical protein
VGEKQAPHTPTPQRAANNQEAGEPVAEYLACRAAWYQLLHEDIRLILAEVGPQAEPSADTAMGVGLASG